MPSPNLPGVANPSAWTPPEQFTYDHIPRLRELLPQLHGVPGFYYLQCAVINKRRAESEGWQEVANTVTYTIRGPSGTIDVSLYCFGSKVGGSDYKSSKRDCLVDLSIQDATGHTISGPTQQFDDPEATPPVEEEKAIDTSDSNGPMPTTPKRVTLADIEAKENKK